MKVNPGSILYDKRRKAWYGLVTFTENGKRKFRRVYGDNKTHARQRLDELRAKLQIKTDPKEITFEFLAEDFTARRLIEARYVGEKKIAGRRELTAPTAWLKRLTEHFGKFKLDKITPAVIEAYKLTLSAIATKSGQRSIAAINRELEFLRTVLNHAVASGWLAKNPFAATTQKLIEKSHETKRERLLGFGEEMALLANCYRPEARNSEQGNPQLRAAIICAADTGLRRKELFTLLWSDVDFEKRVINLRAINAKSNKPRQIPLTARVYAILAPYARQGLIFEGLRDPKRSFGTACRLAGVEDLHWHDLRHSFFSRAILAGVPTAVATRASGHTSTEFERYINLSPDNLRALLSPVGEQTAEAVKEYAREVMLGLRAALQYDQIAELLG